MSQMRVTPKPIPWWKRLDRVNCLHDHKYPQRSLRFSDMAPGCLCIHAATALAAGVTCVYTYDVDDWKLFASDGLTIAGPPSTLPRLSEK